MTSYFARHCELSPRTREAFPLYSDSITDRLYFYFHYLQDVAPQGITVHHIPSEPSNNSRREIQLRTRSGAIFMSGLVSMEFNTSNVEAVAADEAYTKFLDGYFVDDRQSWRFFTAMAQIRAYNCHGGDEWELMGVFHPVRDARVMAAHLQRQYDSLGH